MTFKQRMGGGRYTEDFDWAGFQLGASLGLWDDDPQTFQRVKHVFWSDNPLGNALFECLLKLTEARVLEEDKEECKFRWRFGE